MSDLLIADQSMQQHANELLLAKNTAEVLFKHYPDFLWGVDVNDSIVNIRNLSINGAFGYTLHVPTITTSSDWDVKVMRAGGEILERFRMARARLNVAKLMATPTDFAGRINPTW